MTLIAVTRRPTWISNICTLASLLERTSPSSLSSSSTPTGWAEKLVEVLSTRPGTSTHQQYISSTSTSRPYSTKQSSDDPYRGLALPYPSDARLDTDVFEDSTTLKDYELASLLPHLIRTHQFAAARRAKAQIIRDGQLSKVAYDDIYETMALQALDPRQNERGISRIDAFLGWWSLVPAAPDLMYLRQQPTEVVTRINAILHQIIELEPVGGGNEALIKFSLLAARKGYARAAVSRRAIPQIVMGCSPAVSAKFLSDFQKYAMENAGPGEMTPEVEQANRVIRTQWYRRAILTQVTAGRLKEAYLLFSEQSQRAEIGFDQSFFRKMLFTFHKAGLKEEYEAIQAMYAKHFPRSSSSAITKKIQALKDRRVVGQIPAPSISKNPIAALQYIGRGIRTGKLPSAKYLAKFKYWAIEHHGGLRLLRQIEDELRRDMRPVDRSGWKAYQNRAGFWATSEMIYRLRYRDDAMGSLQVFWKYYEPSFILPRELAWKVEAVLQRSDAEVVGLDSIKAKLWPMSHSTVPLLWESLLAGRVQLGLTFEDLYGALLSSAQTPEVTLQSNADHDSRTISDLRRMNVRKPLVQTSSMYQTLRAPIYLPSASHFNVFIHACVRSPHRTSLPNKESEMVERIMLDMKRFCILPNASTWLMLCLSYVHDRKVDELFIAAQRMRDMKMLNFGRTTRVVNTSVLRQLTEFLRSGSMSLSGERVSETAAMGASRDDGIGKGEKEQAAMIYSALLSALVPKHMFAEARIFADWLIEDGYMPGTIRYLDDLLRAIPRRPTSDAIHK